MGIDKVVYDAVPGGTPEVPSKCLPPKGFGVRHMQTLVLFICLTVGYSIRAQLSVSMVAMINPIGEHNSTTNHNRSNLVEDNDISNETGAASVIFDDAKAKVWSVHRKYNWHKSTQEMILFSFFVGYTTMMIPMGVIAQKYGGKIPIMVALAVNGFISIIFPWVPIFSDWIGLCVCRLVQGMTQAALYPSIHTMLGHWAPLSERGRLSTYIYTGSQFGTVVVFQLSGLFAGNPIFGWPATFWLCGVLSLICCGLLGKVGAATPHEHPNITTEEMAYIMEGSNADAVPKRRKTPWREILTSSAVFGLVVSHAGSAVGYLLVLTQIPTYMSNILGVDIQRNGLYSSLPYFAMYIMSLLFGALADFLANRKMMTIANIRRMANTVGLVVSGLFLIAFSYVNSTLLAVTLLVLSLGAHSGCHVGFHINQIDLAPNFAGPIMALGNMVANLTGLLVPVIVSNIVKDDMTNQRKWQLVFLIIMGFQFMTNTIFVIFVKGKVQPWNFYGDEDENSNEQVVDIKLTEGNSCVVVEEKKKVNP